MDYLEKVGMTLKELCEECKDYATAKCVKPKCNIGFATYAINTAKGHGEQVIKDGVKVIPKEDMKFYDENIISQTIANVLRACNECKENHNENCIISLTRRSLESTYLQDDVVYPGSVLAYLVNVAKQNASFAQKIKNEYMTLA